MVVKKRQLIIWGVNLGLGLVLVLLAWVFGPSLFMEAQYQKQVQQQKSGEPTIGFGALMYATPTMEETVGSAVQPGQGFGEMVAQTGRSAIIPISTDFGIVIPKIFANVAVTENVNPAEKTVYQQVLRSAGGVAHAAGSAVPGESGTTYIFGHSTDAGVNVERFNAVFYLLRKLEIGDEINVYYQGKEFKYAVSEKKTVDPTDISDIINVVNEERLVLQTCWPPGTTWKRLLIIAKPV
ncbi:MAG: sortase [Patescibacteria group bacterium]|nr:sortase [Patescibacteria group bacterium]